MASAFRNVQKFAASMIRRMKPRELAVQLELAARNLRLAETQAERERARQDLALIQGVVTKRVQFLRRAEADTAAALRRARANRIDAYDPQTGEGAASLREGLEDIARQMQELSGAVRSNPTRGSMAAKRKKSSAKKTARKAKRSPAQRAATKRMIAARCAPGKRKGAAKKGRGKSKRSPKQIAATKRMLAALCRPKKGGAKKGATRKGRARKNPSNRKTRGAFLGMTIVPGSNGAVMVSDLREHGPGGAKPFQVSAESPTGRTVIAGRFASFSEAMAYGKKVWARMGAARKNPSGRKGRARKNPRARTTKLGRVLRGQGGVKASARLLADRNAAELAHKRKPRRRGKLTFQSAAYILSHAPRKGGAGRKSTGRKSSGGSRSGGSRISDGFDAGVNSLPGVNDIRV